MKQGEEVCDAMRLSLQDVSVQFRKKEALKHLNIILEPGVYGVIGENGAGKTTLFRSILSLQKYEGMILHEGIDRIGYVPQKFECMQGLNAQELLEYFCCLKDIDKSERKMQAARALELVNLTEERTKRMRELSGGMLRRLGIAQALLGEPQLLIMDDPTVGLDPAERMNLRKIVEQIQAGRIVLISSHEIREIEHMCQYILFLHQGTCLECTSVERLREKYQTEDLEEIYFQVLNQ